MEPKVLDCTLRDGGLVNNFHFSDEFVRSLYETNLKAGIDYMEFGYHASEKQFSRSECGKWKFCREEDIVSVVGENNTSMKLSVMGDIGRTDWDSIPEKKNSVVDMIRIATYSYTADEALERIEQCHAKGYETTVNIMAVSNNSEEEITELLTRFCQSPVDFIYLVDSYGCFFPEQIRRLLSLYLKMGSEHGKRIGIHAHNNQQLAFANTITGACMGASMLDSTVGGMGRGAGNCSTEQLLGYLNKPEQYDELPILSFSEKYILPLRESGVTWGYDVPYLLTGQARKHPRSAIAFLSQKRRCYTELFQELKTAP